MSVATSVLLLLPQYGCYQHNMDVTTTIWMWTLQYGYYHHNICAAWPHPTMICVWVWPCSTTHMNLNNHTPATICQAGYIIKLSLVPTSCILLISLNARVYWAVRSLAPCSARATHARVRYVPNGSRDMIQGSWLVESSSVFPPSILVSGAGRSSEHLPGY